MSGPCRVAVLDAMPAASRQVISEYFGAEFEVVFAADDTAETKLAIGAGAQVLLTMGGAVTAATIAAAGDCRLIQKLGVGTEKIDSAAAEQRGIAVLKAAGINAEAVAELAVLLLLAVSRRLLPAIEAGRSGRIEKELLRAESFQLLGKTVGLLGFGHIGQQLARRLAPFGVRIVYFDQRRAAAEIERSCSASFVEFEELLATADVISLHLPSTPATEHLINDEVLHRTKPGLILLNTARGSLVDEDALVRAIADGRVFGAGLDVTAQEPVSPDSPLHALDRVILTPHVGGAVANNFPRVIDRAYRNTRAFLDGGSVSPDDVVLWPAR